MDKIILIRYSEIHLKGKNIAFFENKLLNNIRNSLKDLTCVVKKTKSRYFVEGFNEDNQFEIIERLKKIFGIHSFSVATVIDTDFEKIKEVALSMATFDGTFKIETNRADKRFPLKSPEISREVGGYILDNIPSLKVNVREPQHTISIDIRETGKTYLYESVIYGSGGLPSGVSGNSALLLSGGIDSPVAGYMMAKRGLLVEGVYFHSYPYTGDLAKEKVISLAKVLKGYIGEFKLNVVHFTEIQEEIHKNCPEELMITIMRRFMMKIAERIAENNKAKSLITGESLGQVASQTIESINVTNAVVKMPVFRPLIGFDKLEIINIAKKIKSYEVSNLPYEDCCTVFLPERPAIKPKIEKVLKAELALNIEELIEKAMSNIEVIEC